MYKGTLIKESISDENILSDIVIDNVEIWKAENHTKSQPLFWTAIMFSTSEGGFLEKLSKALKHDWYVDLSDDIYKIIVFKDKVIRYRVGDTEGKQSAIEYCREIGITESQIDWVE